MWAHSLNLKPDTPFNYKVSMESYVMLWVPSSSAGRTPQVLWKGWVSGARVSSAVGPIGVLDLNISLFLDDIWYKKDAGHGGSCLLSQYLEGGSSRNDCRTGSEQDGLAGQGFCQQRDNLSLLPGTHILKGENWLPGKWSSDIHTCTMAYACLHTYT